MLSINKIDNKILLMNTNDISEQYEILLSIFGKSINSKFNSSLLIYYCINNNNRVIKYLTFKYYDKHTGEIKTGVENTLTSIGYSYEQKWILTIDNLFNINTNTNRHHLLGTPISCNEIAYVPVNYVLNKIDELHDSKFTYLECKVSDYRFIN